jgi:hypothetical protein
LKEVLIGPFYWQFLGRLNCTAGSSGVVAFQRAAFGALNRDVSR